MSQSRLALRFNLKDYRIFIGRPVLAHLKNPKYIEFLYEDDRKILAISGCEKKTSNSCAIPQKVYNDSNLKCVIYRKAFTEALKIRLGWDDDAQYKAYGSYSPGVEMVGFDLTKATKFTWNDSSDVE